MSNPLRIRRSRPAEPQPAPQRVRRVRAPSAEDALGRTRYIIDWGITLPQKFQLYLMTSYLYYYMNRSLIPDHEYDRLCRELHEGWRGLQHQHKHCTDREQLAAGTGFAIQYPSMVRAGAMYMLEKHYEL